MGKVSIGVPVYNGERFLREALDSAVAQTYQDLEIIISDNCSTDATQSICEEYAAKDSRIKYVRQQSNIGAAPNFNFVVHEATGQYFKWLAHDDIIAPTFIEECVKILDSEQDVVLAYTMVKLIDENSKVCDMYEAGLSFDQPTQHERFRSQVYPHRCHEIFGVMRIEELRKTDMIGSYSHGDGIMLAHMSLFGKIYRVPEYLLFPRIHDDQSRKMLKDRASYSEWFDPSNKGKILLPYWRIYYEYTKLLYREKLSFKTRVLCAMYILRETWRYKRALARDIKRALKQIFSGSRARQVSNA